MKTKIDKQLYKFFFKTAYEFLKRDRIKRDKKRGKTTRKSPIIKRSFLP